MSIDSRTRPSPRILILAMFLYVVSLIKFFDRDPLSPQVGPQGPMELALLVVVALTLLLCFPPRAWKLVVTPSAKAFLAFGAIAVASSVFSFYPLLSFAKGMGFILVCGIAIVVSSAFGPAKTLTCLYYLIVITLIVGLILKLAGGEPLFLVDDYAGRARFSMFAWAADVLSNLCAVTLLSGFLLPKRPPFYCQAFLFAINIAADSRTASTLLVVILLAIWLASVRPTLRSVVFLCCCLGSLLILLLWVGIQTNYRPPVAIASIARPLYGDKVAQDIPTLNGRTDVWDAAAPLFAHSIFLGYGLGGARDVLVNHTSWDWVAGDAHNAFIELVLAAGFPAVLVFLLGWAGAARRAWRSRGSFRIGALGTYAFIAGFGIVAPNLTNLQALSTFLIITIDTMVYAEFSTSREPNPVARIPILGKEPLENPAGT